MYNNLELCIIAVCAVVVVGYCIYSIVVNGGIDL